MKELFQIAETNCHSAFERVDAIALSNTEKMLDLFRKHEIAGRHFLPTTGYGYDDVGRDTLAQLYAELFGTEAAIVRPSIVSGTHALSLCLFGLLLPGDELIYASGAPYDTMEEVIGTKGSGIGSLKEMGIGYRQVELMDGKLDLEGIAAAITEKTKLVVIQRSRGYSLRPSLTPADMEPVAKLLHQCFPWVRLMVDNCYGEFVEEKEPTHYGADLCAGSLIKNPGGGLALTGGYIVGSREIITRIAARLTCPGIGLEEGSYAGSYQPFYQGLFMAPHTVAQALKTAILGAAVCEELGLKSTPSVTDARTDIIQALELGSRERLIAFCEGIQMASPVDSMALPEPWDMPGYSDQVIMAAGTFVSGASIELSADAPLREPFSVYMQGGLSYEHGKLALMRAFAYMRQKGCL